MWVESTRITIRVGGVHTGGESGLELSCKRSYTLRFFYAGATWTAWKTWRDGAGGRAGKREGGREGGRVEGNRGKEGRTFRDWRRGRC